MKKLLLMIACLMALTTACKKGQTEPSTKTGQDTDSVEKVDTAALHLEAERQARLEKEAKETETIEKTVEKIYQQVDEAYRGNPNAKSIDLEALYCTDDWSQTVDAVRLKDAPKQDEVGFFDADYWVMGQDVAGPITVSDITVDSLNLDEGTAQVYLNLHNGPGNEPLRLNMLYEKNSWRIDEFTTLEPDTFVWKANMKEYLKKK